jgi:hypothetical protein
MATTEEAASDKDGPKVAGGSDPNLIEAEVGPVTFHV